MKEIRDAAENAFTPLETAVVLGERVDRDERSVLHERAILARARESLRLVLFCISDSNSQWQNHCFTDGSMLADAKSAQAEVPATQVQKAHRQECLCYWLIGRALSGQR
jgi:hypothetical protein